MSFFFSNFVLHSWRVLFRLKEKQRSILPTGDDQDFPLRSRGQKVLSHSLVCVFLKNIVYKKKSYVI